VFVHLQTVKSVIGCCDLDTADANNTARRSRSYIYTPPSTHEIYLQHPPRATSSIHLLPKQQLHLALITTT
jgi:hypothetical protein